MDKSVAWMGKVRQVVLLLSSSRGGSSLLYEWLKSSREFISTRGEINPALKVVGLTPPTRSDDSLLKEDFEYLIESEKATDLAEMIYRDLGFPTPVVSSKLEREKYFSDILFRLGWSWPKNKLNLCDIADAYSQATTLIDEKVPISSRSTELFIKLIKVLASKDEQIDCRFYDLGNNNIKDSTQKFRELVTSVSGEATEELPFIPVLPMRSPSEHEIGNLPLVLKTPACAYRLSFMKRMFPNANFKMLHLVRHPGASINGLMDGWLHYGFGYARVKDLQIKGYPNGSNIWKFDMPPGWSRYINADLTEVTKFQWKSAHLSILDGLDGDDKFQLRFEDITDEKKFLQTAKSLSNWLFGDSRLTATPLPNKPIMATSAPKKNRWLSRYGQIHPFLIGDEEIRFLTGEFGYEI